MKISIIGAGNVGGLTAARIAQEGLGEVLLVDKIQGLAQGKALDLEDARGLIKYNYHIRGTDKIEEIGGSDIIVITAGLARKPGMTREDLLRKNAEILKNIALKIKELAPQAVIIVVTNPLDLMTYFVLKTTGFNPKKVFGMGITLDIARFANLISQELNLSPIDVQACVLGAHGEEMLPIPRLTTIKGVALDEFMDEKKIDTLVKRTIERGKEIVSLLGSGSAYFAPSAAIAELVRVIVKDEKRTLGVSAYLNGEYGLKEVCIGTPCLIGRQGIEKIVELALNKTEKLALSKSAESIKRVFTMRVRHACRTRIVTSRHGLRSGNNRGWLGRV